MVFFLVREVGGLLEGGEGLEVEGGVDRFGSGGVDGLDGADGGLVVVALGDGVELREGEAVDLADEDGGHRGVEEVLEELFCERGRRKTPSVATRHLPRKPGGGEVVGGLWCVCVRLRVHGAPLLNVGGG